MSKLFSVIILCYNNCQYLQGCIDSILMQDYPEIEIIIADDCSTEFDCAYFEKYCIERGGENIKRVLVYQNDINLGTVKNINNAIAVSKGRFIKLIACDDQLADEQSLSNAAIALKEAPYGIITSNVIKCDPDLKVIGLYPNTLQKKLNSMTPQKAFARLCIHNDIVSVGFFMAREFYERFGPFDEAYRLLEDWPMWLKVYREGGRISYMPFAGIKYRANVGFGTSVNYQYMADKKLVLEKEIKPAKKEIGFLNYLKARISFLIINNMFIRKMYGLLVRRDRCNTN